MLTSSASIDTEPRHGDEEVGSTRSREEEEIKATEEASGGGDRDEEAELSPVDETPSARAGDGQSDEHGDGDARSSRSRPERVAAERKSHESRSSEEKEHNEERHDDNNNTTFTPTKTVEILVNESQPTRFVRSGKTRMPKKVAHVDAIVSFGYPYEEEGNTIVILKALGRDNIDEVIHLSESIKGRESRRSRNLVHDRTTAQRSTQDEEAGATAHSFNPSRGNTLDTDQNIDSNPVASGALPAHEHYEDSHTTVPLESPRSSSDSLVVVEETRPVELDRESPHHDVIFASGTRSSNEDSRDSFSVQGNNQSVVSNHRIPPVRSSRLRHTERERPSGQLYGEIEERPHPETSIYTRQWDDPSNRIYTQTEVDEIVEKAIANHQPATEVSEDSKKDHGPKRILKVIWSGFKRALATMSDLGYHHILIGILATEIILLSLVLAGCSTSSGALHNIYLMSFSYHTSKPLNSTAQLNPALLPSLTNITSGANIEVRVSYFGICVGSPEESWYCSSNPGAVANKVSPQADPLNLIWIAGRFKSQIILSVLMTITIVLSGLGFAILWTFPGWHDEVDENGSEREVKPFPSRTLSYLSATFMLLGNLFLILSALWQHVAAVATSMTVQSLCNGAVKTEVGTAAIAMSWAGFGLTIFAFIGLLILILSIRLLDKLTDE